MENKKIKDLMEKFRTGNVFKDNYGNLCIVYKHRYVGKPNEGYYVCDWISFDSTNCSGATRFDTITKEEMCHCASYFEINGVDTCVYDEECEICSGKGIYNNTIFGMDKAKHLGSNVASYIKSRLLKNFDF